MWLAVTPTSALESTDWQRSSRSRSAAIWTKKVCSFSAATEPTESRLCTGQAMDISLLQFFKSCTHTFTVIAPVDESTCRKRTTITYFRSAADRFIYLLRWVGISSVFRAVPPLRSSHLLTVPFLLAAHVFSLQSELPNKTFCKQKKPEFLRAFMLPDTPSHPEK